MLVIQVVVTKCTHGTWLCFHIGEAIPFYLQMRYLSQSISILHIIVCLVSNFFSWQRLRYFIFPLYSTTFDGNKNLNFTTALIHAIGEVLGTESNLVVGM